MTHRGDERLLDEDDPLRDGAPVATRLLAIDEAEEIRDALRRVGISCRMRLVKPVDVDGRDDTAVALGTPPPPETATLVRMPWDEAWAMVERLATAGIHAAVGHPSASGPIEEQEVSVLVTIEELARARAVVPDPADGR
jgi:hypothetical protein